MDVLVLVDERHVVTRCEKAEKENIELRELGINNTM